MPEDEKDPLPVRLKYYTTLTLGLVACLSCFIFMFMVPFFLEPSISTLVANFNPEPVVCKTVFFESLLGMKNCSWSSCKQGCTVDQYKCDRVYVDYMLKPYSEFDGTEYDEEEDIWAVKGVPVFVNIKACGYPPRTNCSVFADSFGPIGSIFACYYSRADPSLVITDYSWGEAVQSLVMALIIPNLLTGISLGVLSYWWYPGCQRRRCQYQLPPDQEAASSHQGDNEDEDDDEDDIEHDADEMDKEQEATKDTENNQKSEKDLDTPVKIPLQ
ncbi:UNVERIFIED_CONTAM: hypothetical protein RMT77_011443 [Armadillidium vulgare]